MLTQYTSHVNWPPCRTSCVLYSSHQGNDTLSFHNYTFSALFTHTIFNIKSKRKTPRTGKTHPCLMSIIVALQICPPPTPSVKCIFGTGKILKVIYVPTLLQRKVREFENNSVSDNSKRCIESHALLYKFAQRS